MDPIGDFVNKIFDRKTPNLIYTRIKSRIKVKLLNDSIFEPAGSNVMLLVVFYT